MSEANYFMVKNHGAFQGYYFWHYIGLDQNAREEFRDSPFFDHTEEFCAKYDQTAFDADYTSNPLEHYEPLIRAVLARPLNSGREPQSVRRLQRALGRSVPSW